MPRTPFSRPDTAWPTLVLLASCYLLWALSFRLAFHGELWASTPLSVLAVYMAFTPMHEATHRSVSRQRWVNEVVGHLSAVFYGGPFVAFRFMHLEHHRWVNGPSDPDHYAGRGPWWTLPVRWLTQDLYYYYLLRRFVRDRRREVPGLVLVMGLQSAVIGTLIATGHLDVFVFAWLIPMRLALCLVVFAFDYLPHRPHLVSARDDRDAATRNLRGKVLQLLFLNQSLHRVHHDFPAVPFYRYGVIFRQRYKGKG